MVLTVGRPGILPVGLDPQQIHRHGSQQVMMMEARMKDDEVDLPSANAPIIRGLVLHRAEARRSANEPVTDFTASGGSALL
jgi:hypothetical protein